MNKCEKCGGMHWRTAPCVQSKKSTVVNSITVDTNPAGEEVFHAPPLSSCATAPDRRAGDKDDQPILSRKEKKAAWMREHMPAYMRQYRADVKSGKRVPKPKAER